MQSANLRSSSILGDLDLSLRAMKKITTAAINGSIPFQNISSQISRLSETFCEVTLFKEMCLVFLQRYLLIETGGQN